VRAGNRAEADDAGDADVADVTRRTRRDTAVENRQPLTEEDDEPGEDECGQRADRGAERPAGQRGDEEEEELLDLHPDHRNLKQQLVHLLILLVVLCPVERAFDRVVPPTVQLVDLCLSFLRRELSVDLPVVAQLIDGVPVADREPGGVRRAERGGLVDLGRAISVWMMSDWS